MTSRRAAVVTGPRTVELRELDGDVGRSDRPTEGEVRVAIAGCGVCGSNVPVWEGRPWFQYPLAPGAPGHEAWGEVTDVGAGVTSVRPGDPVAVVAPIGFADATTVSERDVVALPRALAGATFPGEALGCGFNVAARSRFRAGTTVAVVGVGFIGAIATALAVQAGARVIAISRRPTSLDLARRYGAAETIALAEPHEVVRRVEELTAGDLCPVVVEAVGTQEPLDIASQLTGVGGRLVIAGYHQDGRRSVDVQLWNWRGIDVINAHERDHEVVRAGVRRAADAVVDGTFDPSPLYTHRYPLERLADAMDAAIERPEGFVKALVVT